MTLINYLTRVHFADRVLEEAVRSEVEALGLTRLLLVTSPGAGADTGLARLMAGLPVQTETEIYRDVPRLPGPASVAALIAAFRRSGAEAVIAYGSRSAINLAKLARLHLASGRPPGALPPQGGRAVLATAPPQLIAVPGIDGVGAAVSPQTPVQTEAGYAVLNRHDLLPAVAICDPTLTVGSSRPASASAAVEAIGACIEAFLSNVYNPPADGIALDGARRGAAHLQPLLERNSAETRREMMAAALNGALALQKGYGAGQALCMALTAVTADRARSPDAGAVIRLILPGLLRLHAEAAKEKYPTLHSMLKVAPRDSLPSGVAHLFAALPLPNHLSQMGLARADLVRGADLAADTLAVASTPREVAGADLHAILASVY